MQKIHISLDVWQTLLKNNPQFISERNRIVSQQVGIPEEQVVELFRVNKLNVDGDQERTGKCERSFYLWRDFAWEILDLVWGDREIYNLRNKYNEAWLKNPPIHNPEDVKTLQMLHSAGHTISIISNTGMLSGDILGPWLKSVYGDIFYEMNFSDVTGYAKPNPEAFGESVRWAKLLGLKVVHFGDSEADRLAAAAAGVRCVIRDFANEEWSLSWWMKAEAGIYD